MTDYEINLGILREFGIASLVSSYQLRNTEGRIQVRKVDEDLLQMEPRGSSGTEASGYSVEDRITLITRTGLKVEVLQGHDAYGGTSTNGQSVGEVASALIATGETIEQILRLDGGSLGFTQDHSDEWTITIYKAAGFNWKRWKTERDRRLEAAIRAATSAD